MGTIIKRLPNNNPGSVGLPNIAPSDNEIQLFNTANLLRWFRADAGFSLSGWECMKSGLLLTPAYSGRLPSQVTLAAYNNRQSLLFGSGPTTNGTLVAAGGFPAASSFSLVIVGRAGPSDNAYLVSNGVPAGGSWVQMLPSTGFNSSVEGSTGFTSSGYNKLNSEGPSIFISSFSNEFDQNNLRMNRGRGEWTSALGAVTGVPASNILSVGGRGPAGNLDGTVDNGEIAEVLVFNEALHLNPTRRAVVEAYLGTRYGITAP